MTTPAPIPRMPVIKIHLSENGTTRRIRINKLRENNLKHQPFSFSKLDSLVRHYSGLPADQNVPIVVTYIDEDGDRITISSDEELAEAFEQVMDKTPPVIHAYAKIEDDKVKTQTKADSIYHRIHTLESQVAHMSQQIEVLAKSEKEAVPSQEAIPSQKVESCPEISTTEQAEDPETQVHSDAPESAPTSEDSPKFNLDCYDPNFIHGRHTCDGCYTTPVIGYRYTATNLPDYDLCQKCFKKYKGTEIRFQPEQLERDEHLQRRWKARTQRRKNAQDQMKQCKRGPCQRPVQEIVQQAASHHVDHSLTEAIRRSLLDIENAKKAQEEKKESDSVSTPKQVGTQTETSKEEVSTNLPTPDPPEDVKPEEESGDKIADTKAEMNDPPAQVVFHSNSGNDDDNLSEPGQEIINGDEDDASAAKSEHSGSNWQVVDEDGQVSDEMVARAAQMLGSALFQSDMASTDVHMTTDSVNSGLTSVPTITTTKSEVAPILLQRWAEELGQLHELGFVDDNANVNALGHLEAANMGVDSDEPIKINAVVEHLLKK
jgi:hypothetical protein